MSSPGTYIGPYCLVREIGKGAFGVVWLAERITERERVQVALKVPKPDTITTNIVKEFEALQRAMGHPNVLPLIQPPVYLNQPLLATEYMSEGTLVDWKRSRSIVSVEDASRLATGILKGVGHIHSKGIVHRDLKPANILLRTAEPVIADFGLARLLRAEVSTQSPSGTPSYMSPEAWRNDRCEEADLWAVGVILYELLAGYLPFTGGNWQEIERSVCRDAPPALPSKTPSSLCAVVNKSLRKSKEDRYRTAYEMLNDLTAAVQFLESTMVQHPSADPLIRALNQLQERTWLLWPKLYRLPLNRNALEAQIKSSTLAVVRDALDTIVLLGHFKYTTETLYTADASHEEVLIIRIFDIYQDIVRQVRAINRRDDCLGERSDATWAPGDG